MSDRIRLDKKKNIDLSSQVVTTSKNIDISHGKTIDIANILVDSPVKFNYDQRSITKNIMLLLEGAWYIIDLPVDLNPDIKAGYVFNNTYKLSNEKRKLYVIYPDGYISEESTERHTHTLQSDPPTVYSLIDGSECYRMLINVFKEARSSKSINILKEWNLKGFIYQSVTFGYRTPDVFEGGYGYDYNDEDSANVDMTAPIQDLEGSKFTILNQGDYINNKLLLNPRCSGNFSNIKFDPIMVSGKSDYNFTIKELSSSRGHVIGCRNVVYLSNTDEKIDYIDRMLTFKSKILESMESNPIIYFGNSYNWSWHITTEEQLEYIIDSENVCLYNFNYIMKRSYNLPKLHMNNVYTPHDLFQASGCSWEYVPNLLYFNGSFSFNPPANNEDESNLVITIPNDYGEDWEVSPFVKNVKFLFDLGDAVIENFKSNFLINYLKKLESAVINNIDYIKPAKDFLKVSKGSITWANDYRIIRFVIIGVDSELLLEWENNIKASIKQNVLNIEVNNDTVVSVINDSQDYDIENDLAISDTYVMYDRYNEGEFTGKEKIEVSDKSVVATTFQTIISNNEVVFNNIGQLCFINYNVIDVNDITPLDHPMKIVFNNVSSFGCNSPRLKVSLKWKEFVELCDACGVELVGTDTVSYDEVLENTVYSDEFLHGIGVDIE